MGGAASLLTGWPKPFEEPPGLFDFAQHPKKLVDFTQEFTLIFVLFAFECAHEYGRMDAAWAKLFRMARQPQPARVSTLSSDPPQIRHTMGK